MRAAVRGAAATSWRAGKRSGSFLFRALLLVPLYALLGAAGMLVASLLLVRGVATSGWALLGGGSAVAIYGAAGLLGGGLLGGLAAAGRTLTSFEEEVRGWLRALPAGPSIPGFPEVPVEELRSTYEGVLEQMVERTLGRFRLPGFLRRGVKSCLRRAAIEDFVDWCEASGSTPVGAAEFRDWLLERGVEMAVRPVRLQLRGWRYGTFGVLGVLVAVGVVVRLIG